MPSEFIPCGGCGAESPNDRCIGCMHDFGPDAIVTKLERSRDAWEKHYNEMANKKDAAIARLRALLQKAHDEFAKTDHWYHSDIKEELAKELGL